MSLSGGDMRKVLNILESCSLAYKDIPLKKIYEVTGRPSPDDIGEMFKALSEENYNVALNTVLELKQRKSLALDDIIRDIH